jgi:membrane protein implicated in regulation of membrane protease activity
VSPAQILGLAGLLLVLMELFTASFVLLPLGLACLLTALAAVWIDSWPALFALLSVDAAVVFTVFRRFVRPRFARRAQPTAADGLVGKQAVVTERVLASGEGGYVKLYGDSWRAISASGRDHEVGARVTISGTDGNKVIVD